METIQETWLKTILKDSAYHCQLGGGGVVEEGGECIGRFDIRIGNKAKVQACVIGKMTVLFISVMK